MFRFSSKAAFFHEETMITHASADNAISRAIDQITPSFSADLTTYKHPKKTEIHNLLLALTDYRTAVYRKTCEILGENHGINPFDMHHNNSAKSVLDKKIAKTLAN